MNFTSGQNRPTLLRHPRLINSEFYLIRLEFKHETVSVGSSVRCSEVSSKTHLLLYEDQISVGLRVTNMMLVLFIKIRKSLIYCH